MNKTNKELAEIFDRMAAIYQLKENGKLFKYIHSLKPYNHELKKEFSKNETHL